MLERIREWWSMPAINLSDEAIALFIDETRRREGMEQLAASIGSVAYSANVGLAVNQQRITELLPNGY